MSVILNLLFFFAIVLPTVAGHYIFKNIIYRGFTYADGQYIRRTWNFNNYFPLFDLNSNQLRCFETANNTNPGTLTVSAGESVGFTVGGRIIHEGPLIWYMARAPFRQTASSMSGSGLIWFKINQTYPEVGAIPAPMETYKWPHYNADEVHLQIPKCLPTGDYLLRIEHIALHIAFSEGQHEFFGACAQLRVTSGGAGVPSGFAEFPGAYQSDDPGLLVDIHEDWVLPRQYIAPGPPIWSCS